MDTLINRKLDTKKRALILLISYIVILFTPKLKKNQNKVTINNDYRLEESFPFATYNNYNIYIGSEEYINSIKDACSNNIYIIDGRTNENPNIKIYDSFRIKNRKQILEILKILLEYENKYPTEWHRTIESMENEWSIHNICHTLGIETERTSVVDLDNNDEANYLNLLTIINALLHDDIIDNERDNIKKLVK